MYCCVDVCWIIMLNHVSVWIMCVDHVQYTALMCVCCVKAHVVDICV